MDDLDKSTSSNRYAIQTVEQKVLVLTLYYKLKDQYPEKGTGDLAKLTVNKIGSLAANKFSKIPTPGSVSGLVAKHGENWKEDFQGGYLPQEHMLRVALVAKLILIMEENPDITRADACRELARAYKTTFNFAGWRLNDLINYELQQRDKRSGNMGPAKPLAIDGLTEDDLKVLKENRRKPASHSQASHSGRPKASLTADEIAAIEKSISL